MDSVELYTGKEIYPPIGEQDSAFLEVQLGCSWHQCLFCDFTRDPHRIFSLEEVEEKTKMLVPYAYGKKRIVLLGENPLVISSHDLLTIFGYIYDCMPWMEEICMYARFDDVLRKGERELSLLRSCGLVHLHIGLESGSDTILSRMNKGETIQQGLDACALLKKVGIGYSLTAIPGLGGKELSEEHVQATADFVNQVQPQRLWLIGLKVWPDTPLEDLCKRGDFHPLTLRERLQETTELLRKLELDNCLFVDSTVLDKYTVMGQLPSEKAGMLQKLEALQATEAES